MIDLTGKVVLVTGGSRGIGAAAVRQIVASGGEAVIHFGSNRAAANRHCPKRYHKLKKCASR